MNKVVFVTVVGIFAAISIAISLIENHFYRLVGRSALELVFLASAPALWRSIVIWALRTASRGDAALDEVLTVLEQQRQQESH